MSCIIASAAVLSDLRRGFSARILFLGALAFLSPKKVFSIAPSDSEGPSQHFHFKQPSLCDLLLRVEPLPEEIPAFLQVTSAASIAERDGPEQMVLQRAVMVAQGLRDPSARPRLVKFLNDSTLDGSAYDALRLIFRIIATSNQNQWPAELTLTEEGLLWCANELFFPKEKTWPIHDWTWRIESEFAAVLSEEQAWKIYHVRKATGLGLRSALFLRAKIFSELDASEQKEVSEGVLSAILHRALPEDRDAVLNSPLLLKAVESSLAQYVRSMTRSTDRQDMWGQLLYFMIRMEERRPGSIEDFISKSFYYEPSPGAPRRSLFLEMGMEWIPTPPTPQQEAGYGVAYRIERQFLTRHPVTERVWLEYIRNLDPSEKIDDWRIAPFENTLPKVAQTMREHNSRRK